jgi:predicted molibdopterin-dependent oxidoreductase YjgC
VLGYADIFLQLKPGTDVALVNGMIKGLIDEGLIDKEFISLWTKGYESLADSVKAYTPEKVEAINGVPVGNIIKAARAYAISLASNIAYSMGITQHIHWHRQRPGLGQSSPSYRPNRQSGFRGRAIWVSWPSFIPGYMKADNPATAEFFSNAWGMESLPSGKGLAGTEMIDTAADGTIRAMYIVGEDPANSDPRCFYAAETLSKLDFLVVQDIFLMATA